jgi:hypothetical protein
MDKTYRRIFFYYSDQKTREEKTREDAVEWLILEAPAM